jgi:hypothetical protein
MDITDREQILKDLVASSKVSPKTDAELDEIINNYKLNIEAVNGSYLNHFEVSYQNGALVCIPFEDWDMFLEDEDEDVYSKEQTLTFLKLVLSYYTMKKNRMVN